MPHADRTTERMTLAQWGMLLLLGAIWGGTFFFAHIALAELSPLVLVMLRVGIAAAALHIYLWLRGPSFRPALPYAGAFLVLALINNVLPFSLIFAGQTATGAGLAAVLNATTPFWTLLLVRALGRESRLPLHKLAGVLLGVAGTAVTIGPGLASQLGGPLWAKLAFVGASGSYAVALLYARRFSRLPPVLVAAGQLTASTAIMVPVVVATQDAGMLFAAGPGTWTAVFALALVSTAFAYMLYFRLIAEAGPTNASLVTLVVPASAILLSAAFLGERLALFELSGMLLIALGLISIDGRLLPSRGITRGS
ncbi:MAG: DMT family transporter [Rhizobiaceae bacterium]|nr:DMT family transporter [Rhizobiaceae bacterium]